MDHLVSRLLFYGDLGSDSLLVRLAELARDRKAGSVPQPELIQRLYAQVRQVLALAAEWGIDGNLWQHYLTYLLMTHETPFTLAAERVGVPGGTFTHFAQEDCHLFRELFHYDFTPAEAVLDTDCFSQLSRYEAPAAAQAPAPPWTLLRDLSRRLADAPDDATFFACLTDHYRRCGVGQPSLYRAFRVQSQPDGSITMIPVQDPDSGRLDDLVGCEAQSALLRRNTESFLAGRGANNVLLYGDAGTGKSSSVKALMNEYYDQGLRMVELYKHQLQDLPAVLAKLKTRKYRFILFLDDLSFEEHEVEYKYLKGVIEGGVETRPDNVRIYATSNRRNLIRETWRDRADMEHDNDVHHSDTVEETLSLSARFGLRIYYPAPNPRQFQDLVLTLAQRQELPLSEADLLAETSQWSRRRGSASGRTARQLVDALSGFPPDPYL